MQKHKRKNTHDCLTRLACYTCRRSGSFWIARTLQSGGKMVLVPCCSRCVKVGDEVVYDSLEHEADECLISREPAKEGLVARTSLQRQEEDWLTDSLNVRPIFVNALLNTTSTLQRCLHNVFGDENVDVIMDQCMYGMWRSANDGERLSIQVSPLSCVRDLEAIGIWSITGQGRLEQVDIFVGQIKPGASVTIQWVDDDTISIPSGVDTSYTQALNEGFHSGIRGNSFGLYFRSRSGTYSFSLDCWNGEEARMLGFQNPQREEQWIISCNEQLKASTIDAFHHPILEITGMLPERRMLTPSISRYLNYQRELVW